MAPTEPERTRLNAPDFTSVLELLQGQARRRPEAIALIGPEGSSTTYGRLAGNVEAMARALREFGLRTSDRVAVVLANGPEMAAAFLAVSANGVFVPLNPAYRRQEFDFLLSDVGARALVVASGSDSPARPAARALGLPILEAASDPDRGLSISGPRIGGASVGSFGGAEDVALVLYTSGMTSKPKAVPLTHQAICTAAHNIAVALELEPKDRCVNVMPLFHAHGLVIALLSSLTAGASTICTRGFSPETFFEHLEAFRPTWYTSAPTIHHAVLEEAPAHKKLLDRRDVRFIRSSAAFLPAAVRAGLEREFGAPVIEAYGMTECPQITSNPLSDGRRKIGSVGLPAGPEVAIVSGKGDLVPAGERGEIVIRGPVVTRGYDNQVAAHESALAGEWFRTGDQGVLSPDGYLSLTGRLKDIINSGGEKIAPSEIDEVLLSHPAVFEAVAFGVPHPTLGEDVAAAVVLRPDISATEKNLRDFVATRLADYKVPSQILIVPEIPKSPTGKLKRAGLAEILGLVAPQQGYDLRARPADDPDSVRSRFAKMWSDVLKVQTPEENSHFFRSGGDSVQASRLVARVRKDLQFELSLHTLFVTPTFAALCAEIERGRREPSADPGRAGAPQTPAVSAGGGVPAETPRTAYQKKEAVTPRKETSAESFSDADLRFSLFFFSADGSESSADRYRLVLEASRFADRHGYAAVWTPERHFHPFGGPYPNPAVLGAAIAMVTDRLQIRAASVVLPLQNPIRVAEEWSVVDNLSHGRVGVSFASGWHVNDFVLSPANYTERRQIMFEGIRTVRDLWEGRPVTAKNGLGNEVSLNIFPKPIQPSLPVWLSCQSEATFQKAGELGVNAITAMYSMSLAELAQRVASYREARARAGHDPASGEVAVCVHTFVAENQATVDKKVKSAYLDYLLVNLGLHADRVKGSGDDFAPSEEDREFLMRKASENLFNERGLVGTVAHCQERVAALAAIGVNEIACLIDFGIDFDSVMAALYQLNQLKQLAPFSARPVPTR